MDFFHEGHWRMDWGFGNPNKTAVLLACLMVASWGLTQVRGWGFRGALLANALLAVALIHTYSRGGLLAAAAGQLVWWSWAWPALKARQRWWGGAVLAGLAIYAHLGFVEAGGRYWSGLPWTAADRSISNRLTMWRWAPRMMVDAPQGWGRGRAGEAYTQWYQDPSTRYRYRTLVSSHLTRLVEGSWTGRWLYLFGWLAAVGVCWPVSRAGPAPVPLACWVAFGVGGLFSTVDEAWVLWVLPVLGLAWRVQERFRFRSWEGVRRSLPLSMTAAFAGVGGMALWGWMTPETIAVRARSGQVRIGATSESTVALILPERRILGEHYGLTLRSRLGNAAGGTSVPGWLVVTDEKSLPEEAGVVVFSGTGPREGRIPASRRWIWLNPQGTPASVMEFLAGQSGPGTVVMGALRKDPVARRLLTIRAERWCLRREEGKQLFLSNWVDLIEQEQKTPEIP